MTPVALTTAGGTTRPGSARSSSRRSAASPSSRSVRGPAPDRTRSRSSAITTRTRAVMASDEVTGLSSLRTIARTRSTLGGCGAVRLGALLTHGAYRAVRVVQRRTRLRSPPLQDRPRYLPRHDAANRGAPRLEDALAIPAATETEQHRGGAAADVRLVALREDFGEGSPVDGINLQIRAG